MAIQIRIITLLYHTPPEGGFVKFTPPPEKIGYLVQVSTHVGYLLINPGRKGTPLAIFGPYLVKLG